MFGLLFLKLLSQVLLHLVSEVIDFFIREVILDDDIVKIRNQTDDGLLNAGITFSAIESTDSEPAATSVAISIGSA